MCFLLCLFKYMIMIQHTWKWAATTHRHYQKAHRRPILWKSGGLSCHAIVIERRQLMYRPVPNNPVRMTAANKSLLAHVMCFLLWLPGNHWNQLSITSISLATWAKMANNMIWWFITYIKYHIYHISYISYINIYHIIISYLISLGWLYFIYCILN